jgi:hypothetical protein
LRIYQASGFSFAVVICSELLTVAAGSFLEKLAREKVDLVLWLQHNPYPRHTDFSPALGSFFQFTGDQPLVVSLNKQPDQGKRGPYGASCIYAPASSFGGKKDRVLRPNFVTEPLAHDAHEVSRAVFVRYDVAAHHLQTVLPAHIPAGGAPGQFLSELAPYTFIDGALSVSDDPQHYLTLFASGEQAAWQHASLGVDKAELTNRINAELVEVKKDFSRSPSLLLNFLDTAFVRSDSSRHLNHQAHTPAARCDCWPHRINFDSLFEGDMPGRVAELLLSIAALRAVASDVNPNQQCVREFSNLTIAKTKLILASAKVLLDEFVDSYFRDHHSTDLPVVVALRTERKLMLPKSAARHSVVGRLNAGRVETPVPKTVSGSEFWQSVRDGTLLDRITARAGGLQ